MKEWRILLFLEFDWRMFKFYRKLVNWLVKKGMKLSSPILCMINQGLDYCGVEMVRKQRIYERLTGQVIRYYKSDEI
ncbi:hypothetical protein HNQ56_000992 [Anaerotaenia torta]|uniref:hypothetical protein n=1 Tax=Anaerotaenia torta TaxID=433293 RepID=UPI003D2026FE